MPSAAGWVDRTAQSPASGPAPIKPTVAPPVSKTEQPGGPVAAGAALVVVGLATMESTAWMGFRILTTPIRLARVFLISD